MHRTQQQHHAVLAHDFHGKQLLEVLAHGEHVLRNFKKLVVRKDAHFRVFKCDQIARVDHAGQAVETDDVARHMKACDLFATVGTGDGALEKSQTDGIERIKAVARAIKRLTSAHALSGAHQLFKPFDFFEGEAERQAQFAQVAVGARHSKRCHVDRGVVEHKSRSQTKRPGSSAHGKDALLLMRKSDRARRKANSGLERACNANERIISSVYTAASIRSPSARMADNRRPPAAR